MEKSCGLHMDNTRSSVIKHTEHIIEAEELLVRSALFMLSAMPLQQNHRFYGGQVFSVGQFPTVKTFLVFVHLN